TIYHYNALTSGKGLALQITPRVSFGRCDYERETGATMPSQLGSAPSPDQVEAVAKRIEALPGGPAVWALDFAQRDLGAMTAGDWYNLRLELLAWLRPFSERPESESLPSEEEARRIQRRFAIIIAGLVRDGRVQIGRYDVGLTVAAPHGVIAIS